MVSVAPPPDWIKKHPYPEGIEAALDPESVPSISLKTIPGILRIDEWLQSLRDRFGLSSIVRWWRCADHRLWAGIPSGYDGRIHVLPHSPLPTPHPQPSTLNPQPSTLNPQPSTFFPHRLCRLYQSHPFCLICRAILPCHSLASGPFDNDSQGCSAHPLHPARPDCHALQPGTTHSHRRYGVSHGSGSG